MVDGDLSNYFGEIPHAELIRNIAHRVSDGRMLKWIKARLEMPVEEDDGKSGAPSLDSTQNLQKKAKRGYRGVLARIHAKIARDAGGLGQPGEGESSAWHAQLTKLKGV